MLGTFMAVLDSTIVNVGLPKIMASFGVSLDKIEWVATAYMLAMAVTLPTSAWLADRFGYKRIYFLGLLLFTVGSLLCGMSGNEGTLIFSRIIQGFGAGTIQPLGMAIITREFPAKQRGVALGFWAVAAAASVSFGPLIGGYLVDNFSWQLIFYVNLPVGIGAMLFTILIQREYKNKQIGKFDYIGFSSIVVSIPLLLYALSEGNAATNAEGWHAPHILLCFAISAIAFAVFIAHELNTPHPLIDLRLLKNFNFGLSNLIMVIFSMGMFGSTFLLPLYLQNSLGYSALQAGAVFLPVGIIQGIMSPVSGALANRIDARVTMVLGILLLVLSFYINSDLSFLTEHRYIMTSLYIRGFALGLIFTQMSTLSMLTIPRHKMAQASSISNTVRQIGGSFGVAIFTTVLSSRINFHAQIFGNAIQSTSQDFKNVIANLATHIQTVGGSSHALALKQAQALLMSNVSKQAYIQGIDDDFLIAAVITLLGVIPTIFLQTKIKTPSNA
jgi:DHA2 family multidrug resistance protein